MKRFYWIGMCLYLLLQLQAPAMAQNSATIREFEKEFKTYPFSDPDPVPNAGNIYPYYRLMGLPISLFSKNGKWLSWRMISLNCG